MYIGMNNHLAISFAVIWGIFCYQSLLYIKRCVKKQIISLVTHHVDYTKKGMDLELLTFWVRVSAFRILSLYGIWHIHLHVAISLTQALGFSGFKYQMKGIEDSFHPCITWHSWSYVSLVTQQNSVIMQNRSTGAICIVSTINGIVGLKKMKFSGNCFIWVHC